MHCSLQAILLFLYHDGLQNEIRKLICNGDWCFAVPCECRLLGQSHTQIWTTMSYECDCKAALRFAALDERLYVKTVEN
jgi:hypothetical protein